MPALNLADAVRLGSQVVDRVYLGSALVWGGATPWNEHLLVFGAVGDSITRNSYSPSSQGGNVGETLIWTGRSWGFWACALSQRKCWANVFAFEGYSGQTAGQIRSSMLDADATCSIGAPGNQLSVPYGVRATKPDYTFVMAGTNDLYFGVDLATCIANLRGIWADIRAAGSEPIAISLLPRDDDPLKAAQVPTWNAAIGDAASDDAVLFIDVYTNCNDGSGGFKPGWTYINNAIDPLGLHPGNEACWSMAVDIAAALSGVLPNYPRTPYVSSETAATLETSAVSSSEIALKTTLGGGTFQTLTGWTARYDPSASTTASVSPDGLALAGNALVVEQSAGDGGSKYADRYGPDAYAVTPGARYALCARVAFEADGAGCDLMFGIQDAANIGSCLFAFLNQSGCASSASGASIPAIDVYHEFTVPPGVAAVRLWITQQVEEGSAGNTFKLADVGLIEL